MVNRSGSERGRIPHSACGILSAAEFEQALRGERERADRVRQPFAVLAFGRLEGEASALLWDAAGSRIRSTDALGWLPDRRQGILLRGATVRHAVRLAEEIQRTLSAHRTDCTVHGYPPFEYELRAGWGPLVAEDRVPARLPTGGLEVRPGEDPPSAVDLMKSTERASQ